VIGYFSQTQPTSYVNLKIINQIFRVSIHWLLHAQIAINIIVQKITSRINYLHEINAVIIAQYMLKYDLAMKGSKYHRIGNLMILG